MVLPHCDSNMTLGAADMIYSKMISRYIEMIVSNDKLPDVRKRSAVIFSNFAVDVKSFLLPKVFVTFHKVQVSMFFRVCGRWITDVKFSHFLKFHFTLVMW